ETIPETLCCLLAPERYRDGSVPRERFVAIQQVHFGTRDLAFGGGFYRPEHAGYNDLEDVRRLAEYLDCLQPEGWTVADLAELRGSADEEERADELAFAREWLPPLRELYRRIQLRRQILVCELL